MIIGVLPAYRLLNSRDVTVPAAFQMETASGCLLKYLSAASLFGLDNLPILNSQRE